MADEFACGVVLFGECDGGVNTVELVEKTGTGKPLPKHALAKTQIVPEKTKDVCLRWIGDVGETGGRLPVSDVTCWIMINKPFLKDFCTSFPRNITLSPR